MKNSNITLNENAIREAAYFIWRNNGCPANTSLQDWNAAINQLTSLATLNSAAKSISSSSKTSSSKTLASKASALVKKSLVKTASKTTKKKSSK